MVTSDYFSSDKIMFNLSASAHWVNFCIFMVDLLLNLLHTVWNRTSIRWFLDLMLSQTWAARTHEYQFFKILMYLLPVNKIGYSNLIKSLLRGDLWQYEFVLIYLLNYYLYIHIWMICLLFPCWCVCVCVTVARRAGSLPPPLLF